MTYHLYQTEAFVLDDRPLGEANRIYFLLTPDLGLVAATAQGIRLLRSKLRFHLNKYAHVQVVLVRGKEIWRLVGVEKTDDYEDIYLDPVKQKLAAKIFTLLRRFIQGESPQKSLFKDLKKSLDYLAKVDLSGEFVAGWEQVAVLRLLHFLGYIKDTSKLGSFLEFKDWSEDVLREADVNRGVLVSVINEAINASHI